MDKDYVTFECVHIVDVDENNPDENRAVAYADIDGYPADEDGMGAVICRVWLLRRNDRQKKDRDYLVDWHDNRYRTNQDVLGLIRDAKTQLEMGEKRKVDIVFERAYGRYRLKWMLDNNYSLDDLLSALQEEMAKDTGDIWDALGRFMSGGGFKKFTWGKKGKEIVSEKWRDKDDFQFEEWKDPFYMGNLLSGRDYEIWNDNVNKGK